MGDLRPYRRACQSRGKREQRQRLLRGSAVVLANQTVFLFRRYDDNSSS